MKIYSDPAAYLEHLGTEMLASLDLLDPDEREWWAEAFQDRIVAISLDQELPIIAMTPEAAARMIRAIMNPENMRAMEWASWKTSQEDSQAIDREDPWGTLDALNN